MSLPSAAAVVAYVSHRWPQQCLFDALDLGLESLTRRRRRGTSEPSGRITGLDIIAVVERTIFRGHCGFHRERDVESCMGSGGTAATA